MDELQLSPPTVRTHKISTNSVRFPWFVYEIPFHADTRPMSKVLEAKEERMSDQSKEAHSFPRKFSRNKQTEIVRIHKVHIRLQVERSNFWTDREKQNKRNTALNMDRRNVRNPELQLPGFSVCSRRVRGLDDLPLRVSFHEETRQVGHVVVSFT